MLANFAPQNFVGSVGPQLLVLKVLTPAIEKVNKDGHQKTVYTVVKNAPFTVELGLATDSLYNQNINLNHCAFDAELVYDQEGPEKGVDFVRVKPVVCKAKVNNDGDKVTLDVRIKVLTSQHEDMNFKVKFKTLDARTGREVNPRGMTVLSDPIRVISKTDQLKKQPLVGKNRISANDVVSKVAEVEKLQEENDKLLSTFVDGISSHSSDPIQNNDWSMFGDPSISYPTNMNLFTPNYAYTDFSSHFQNCLEVFLNCYCSLVSTDKMPKIRNLCRTLTRQDQEVLINLLEEIHKQTSGHGKETISKCECQFCPYIQKLKTFSEQTFDF